MGGEEHDSAGFNRGDSLIKPVAAAFCSRGGNLSGVIGLSSQAKRSVLS